MTDTAPATSLRPVARPTQAARDAIAQIANSEVEGVCTVCPDEKPDCDLITGDMLRDVYNRATDAERDAAARELNHSISIGKIDTHEKLSHFLGQTKHEGGGRILVSENLTYSATALTGLFRFYRNNPALARQHGYTDRNNKSAADQEAIANHAYAGRIGNGNAASGDGWRFRGRGIKQLTGRSNYADFTTTHTNLWGEAQDFEANPDLIATDVKYAVRSALGFWVDNGLDGIASGGVTRSASHSVTDVINPGERSSQNGRNPNRWAFTNQIHTSGTFADVCYNRSWVNSNEQAKQPAEGGPR